MTPEARGDVGTVAARCCEWIGPDRDRFDYREPAYYCAVFYLELRVPCEHIVERGAASGVALPGGDTDGRSPTRPISPRMCHKGMTPRRENHRLALMPRL